MRIKIDYVYKGLHIYLYMNLLKNRNWNCNSKICFGGTCAYFICLNVSIYYIYSCNYITLLFYLCLKRFLSLLIIVLLLCVVVLLKSSRTSDLMKLKTLNFLISKFFTQSNPLQLSYFLLLPSFALWKLNNINNDNNSSNNNLTL